MASTGAPSAALNSKRVIYVGGLPDEATEDMIRAAFIPFGDCSVSLPMDYVKGKHRGFAFVEMQEPEDAAEAIFNMNGAELMSRVIRVSLAQANQLSKLHQTAASTNANNSAIWNSDEWFQQQQQEQPQTNAEEAKSEQARNALQE